LAFAKLQYVKIELQLIIFTKFAYFTSVSSLLLAFSLCSLDLDSKSIKLQKNILSLYLEILIGKSSPSLCNKLQLLPQWKHLTALRGPVIAWKIGISHHAKVT